MKAIEGISVTVTNGEIKAHFFDKDGFLKHIPASDLSEVREVIVDTLNKETYDKIKYLKIGNLYILSSRIEVSDISGLQVEKISNKAAMGYFFNEDLVVPADIKLPPKIHLHKPIVYIPESAPNEIVVTDLKEFQTDVTTAYLLVGANTSSIHITSGELVPGALSGFPALSRIETGKGVTFWSDAFVCPSSCKQLIFQDIAPDALLVPSSPREISFGKNVPTFMIASSGVFSQISVNKLTPKNVINLEYLKIENLIVKEITAKDISGLNVDYLGSVPPCQNSSTLMKVPAGIKFPSSAKHIGEHTHTL